MSYKKLGIIVSLLILLFYKLTAHADETFVKCVDVSGQGVWLGDGNTKIEGAWILKDEFKFIPYRKYKVYAFKISVDQQKTSVNIYKELQSKCNEQFGDIYPFPIPAQSQFSQLSVFVDNEGNYLL